MKIAVYPGSFDPITLGHLNIIKRAARCFDRLVVCVMVNSDKHGLFSPEERLDFLLRVVKGLPNVEADLSTELLAAYAKRKGARFLVKGLRAISDYENEIQMATINQKLNQNLDTMFLPANEKYLYLSSSIVKELALYNADLSDFVPGEILEDVLRTVKERRALNGDRG